MQKRIFIVHRWDGSPGKDWLPWVKKKLEKKKFEVIMPAMPNPEIPMIEEWVPFLANLVQDLDENTFLIGHSIGCQTIMRYLESMYPEKIGGIVFIAPWFHLKGLEDEESMAIAKPWLDISIDVEKVRNATDNISIWMSDDDPFVPLSDKKIFEEKLGAKVIVMNKQGHFTEDDGVMEMQGIIDILN